MYPKYPSCLFLGFTITGINHGEVPPWPNMCFSLTQDPSSHGPHQLSDHQPHPILPWITDGTWKPVCSGCSARAQPVIYQTSECHSKEPVPLQHSGTTAVKAAAQDAFTPSNTLSMLSMPSAIPAAQGIVNTQNTTCLLTELQNAD